jgi:hypothetical protein
MTANKRTVAGAAAAFLVVVAAGMLSGCQKPDNGSADRSGRGAAAPAGATTPGASAHPAADLTPADKARTAAHKRDKADKNDKDSDKPLWRTLTQAQQVVLQPLRAEWDAMDGLRKQKWLQLANRFATLPPQEQQRVQQRMREWASLTPEQRELARETYNRARKITPADKNATWESYQQLPEDQKRKLAATSATRKSPSVVPSQANGKVVTPQGPGPASCPPGTVRNPASGTPPCIGAPVPAPGAPSVQPATPPNAAPRQDKGVPANWGITPNDA